MMNPILKLIDTALNFYGLIVFIYVLVRLLIYFQVVNSYQPFVAKVMQILGDIVEPALNFIRKYVKPFRNVDLSPLILILLITFLRDTIHWFSFG